MQTFKKYLKENLQTLVKKLELAGRLWQKLLELHLQVAELTIERAVTGQYLTTKGEFQEAITVHLGCADQS